MKKQKTSTLSKNKIKFILLKRQALWFICGLLLASCVLVTIQGASTGAQLLVLEEEKSNLAVKNKELSTQLVESTSLLKIEEVAGELGFTQPGETLYIKEKKTVANLP